MSLEARYKAPPGRSWETGGGSGSVQTSVSSYDMDIDIEAAHDRRYRYSKQRGEGSSGSKSRRGSDPDRREMYTRDDIGIDRRGREGGGRSAMGVYEEFDERRGRINREDSGGNDRRGRYSRENSGGNENRGRYSRENSGGSDREKRINPFDRERDRELHREIDSSSLIRCDSEQSTGDNDRTRLLESVEISIANIEQNINQTDNNNKSRSSRSRTKKSKNKQPSPDTPRKK